MHWVVYLPGTEWRIRHIRWPSTVLGGLLAWIVDYSYAIYLWHPPVASGGIDFLGRRYVKLRFEFFRPWMNFATR
jgi:peptidoglycan/LPS O-acetylase OafA/YrhL